MRMAYAIGAAQPVMVEVDTFKTGTVCADDCLADAVKLVLFLLWNRFFLPELRAGFVQEIFLSAGSADIKLPAEFQCVLQGVGFMGILCNTGWERKMPGFDCVIAMVDANVHGFCLAFVVVEICGSM